MAGKTNGGFPTTHAGFPIPRVRQPFILNILKGAQRAVKFSNSVKSAI